MYLHISFEVIIAVERSKAKCLELGSYHIPLTKNKNKQRTSEFLLCRSVSIFTVNNVYAKKNTLRFLRVRRSKKRLLTMINKQKNISRQNKEKRKSSKKEEQILQGLYSSLYSTSDQCDKFKELTEVFYSKVI